MPARVSNPFPEVVPPGTLSQQPGDRKTYDVYGLALFLLQEFAEDRSRIVVSPAVAMPIPYSMMSTAPAFHDPEPGVCPPMSPASTRMPLKGDRTVPRR